MRNQFSRKCQRYLWAITCALAGSCATQTSFAAAITGSMVEPFDYPDATQFINASTLNGGLGCNLTGTADPNAAVANWGFRQQCRHGHL